MNWLHAPIGTVAPAQTSSKRLPPDSEVWQLSLDQIESDTGRIVGKKKRPVEEAGSSTYVFDSGNVLYSKLRPYLNKVVCPNEVGIATSELVPLRPREKLLDRRYLTYYLRSPGFVSFATITVAGVKMPRIIMNKFWEHQIPLPTLTEQRRIVEILDQADALRQQRRTADEKAQRILPALFYHMFGDPLLNPHRWQVMRLGDPRVADINPRADTNGMADDTEVSFVPMADVDEVWGRIVGTQTRPLADVRKGFTSFADGDVIFAKITPCMQNGKAAIASKLRNGRAFGSTEFHVLRAGSVATKEWLYGLVRLGVFRKQAEASFTGTAGQQRVPTTFLRDYEVPVPPLALQDAFASAVQTVLTNVSTVDDLQVTGVFDNLLHRAFSGELTAKWRDTHREELEAEMQAQAKALADPAPRSSGRGRKRRSP